MAWWGKVIGGAFGFAMGGPLGAALGAALGHNFDRGMSGVAKGTAGFDGNAEQVQSAFFTATFSMMGYVAKADGQVSREEISVAENVMGQMRLNAEQRKAAMHLFNQGKQQGFPADEILEQFRRACHRRRHLLQMFMEIQIFTALADGTLHANEKKILQHCATCLGFSAADFNRLLASMQAQQRSHQQAGQQQSQQSLGDAYKVLGIASNASDEEVKKAYRRQMNQHHPDKLVAKGLPEEMMTLAKEKTQDIRQAYETIKDSRKRA